MTRTLGKPVVVSILFLAALIAAGCSSSDSDQRTKDVQVRDDWGVILAEADITGTFVLREVGSNVTSVWDPERAEEARLPASTFKILNSLIILETGVLTDTETPVPWDGVERSVSAWNQDHSLRTGIEVSAVWAYQDLARQVGEQRMQDWVTRSRYGNADIGGGIDQFWLRGDLRISPLQQLDFLEDLVRGDLPFSEETVAAVSDILIRERGDGWTWSHKTGTSMGEEADLGWLVGYAIHDERTFVFAMNLDLQHGSPLDLQIRQDVARRILESEGALPT